MSLMSTELGSASGFALLSKGKVRDIYALDSNPELLLLVTTDRISVYDVVLSNGIPDRGKILTTISSFWFQKLSHIIPNHLVTTSVPLMPPLVHQYTSQLQGRTMLVKKAQVVPIEAIVRGYLTGSAWVEYRASGTVHGISMPPGLIECQRLQEPIFTPSTKASEGHDENISPDQAKSLIGSGLYSEISETALLLYKEAAAHCQSRGLILADTKFEFGLVPSQDEKRSEKENAQSENLGHQTLILIDEVLTPDSSRYWPLADYSPGHPQPSFDKQFARDALIRAGFKNGRESEKWTLDPDVVQGTRERYVRALEMLTGQEGQAILA